MFSFLIKRQNKNAELFTAAAFLVSVIFLISAAIGLRPIVLCQFFFTLFFTLAVIISKRYLLTGFCYIIGCDSGICTLTVLQKTGKKESVVCRIEYDKISGYELVSRKKKEKSKAQKIKKGRYYNYCASLFPSNFLLISYVDGEKEEQIQLEADKKFIVKFKETFSGWGSLSDF